MCYRQWKRTRRPSQLLQAAVHVSLAALPGPGATLEAELPQVLLVVLVVHGHVGLRFTLWLRRREQEDVKLLKRQKAFYSRCTMCLKSFQLKRPTCELFSELASP